MWVPLHAGRIDAVLLELAEEGVTEGVGPNGPPRVGQLVPVAGQREPDSVLSRHNAWNGRDFGILRPRSGSARGTCLSCDRISRPLHTSTQAVLGRR